MHKKYLNPLIECQLKSDSDEPGVFEGYASKFDQVDKVGDTILKGAFAKSLITNNVKGFLNHDSSDVPPIDWLELKEDDVGLYAVGKVDLEHHMGKSIYSALKRGAIDGLSIGFTAKPGDFEVKKGYEGKGNGNRTYKNLHLMEISPVTWPCDEGARIQSVKMADANLVSLKDCEHYLRDAWGLSKAEATEIVSRVAKIVRGDPGEKQEQTAMDVKLADAILSFGKRFK
jgi:HK97 family phage prohead protease